MTMKDSGAETEAWSGWHTEAKGRGRVKGSSKYHQAT